MNESVKLALARGQAEWRGNPRLRYGAMAIVAILALQVVFMLSDAVNRRVASHGANVELLSRMDGLAKESYWPQRARAAQAALQQATARIPQVAGKGMAQADAQAWLTQLAASHGVTQPQVKVEPAVDVDGHPDLWQVMARLDGGMPAYGQQAVFQALAKAMPWVQVERVDLDMGNSPHFAVTVRSYYRRAVPGAATSGTAAAVAKTAEGTP